MKIRPVILCGGAGTRLWPKGSKHQAKQFIDFGGWTLINKTFERIKNNIYDYPIISTNAKYIKEVKKALKKSKIKKFKIVLEPSKKNTAPAILTSALIKDIPNNQPLMYFTADHLIENPSKLNREIIKDYAEQYYQHVKAFPRYISATHSLCEDISKRKILLENLQDEENQNADHPKLWKNFALAMGADPKKIENVKQDWFTKEMIENFFKQARLSYAEGLASLYTYERQIPEIAETKIRGLKKFYGVTSKEGLEFFEAHKAADVIHRKECEKLLDALTEEEKEKAEKASVLTARYLWNFLSGMSTKHKIQAAA